MIKEDRELLAKLSTVNQHMGEIVLRLLSDLPSRSALPASELRKVGSGLSGLARELHTVANAMYTQANDLDQATAGTAPNGAVPTVVNSDRVGGAK